jgi:hypothetical protein
VGTSVPLDVLGIANVHAKAHITEGGPFDIAPIVAYYALPRADFSARYLQVGGIASIQIAQPWSVHLGGGWSQGTLDGNIDLSDPLSLLWFLDSGAQGDPSFAGDLLDVQTVTARAATDIRFNRRDSIVIQGEAVLWTHIERDDDLWVPDFLGLEEALKADGWVPLTDAGAASIAWQFAWEHWELRLGAGISSAPGAWLLQSTELSYRFGGKSRVRESRMRETWEKNKEELPSGLDSPGTEK